MKKEALFKGLSQDGRRTAYSEYLLASLFNDNCVMSLLSARSISLNSACNETLRVACGWNFKIQ
jgi:hypothetical protein